MKRLKTLLALSLVALLALSGIAMARDHGHHGRHHHRGHNRLMPGTGTISSFDATTGKLTIALTGGESFSGLVTQGTEIKCEGIAQRRDHGGGGNGGPGNSGSGGDNSGQGTEPGDDNGGRGEEPGDDNGGQFEPGDDHGGQGQEPGDDNGGQGEEPGDDNGGEVPAGAPGCSTASLVPGATVGSAELHLEGGGAVFREIELGNHS